MHSEEQTIQVGFVGCPFPIHVDAYSGYKASERPRQFTLDEEIYEIAAVLDPWYEPMFPDLHAALKYVRERSRFDAMARGS